MAVPAIADISVSGTSSTSPISHTIPGTWSAGDLVIAWVMTAVRTVSSTTFPGSSIQNSGAGDGNRTYSYWRILQAGDLGTSYSWTLNANPSNSIIYYLRITGAHATTPIDASAAQEDAASSTTHDSPSVTTTSDECLILRLSSNGNQGFSASSGDTGTRYANRTAAPGYEIWSSSKSPAGSTGTATYTTTVSRRASHHTIAIAPAASGASGPLLQGKLTDGGILVGGRLIRA